MPVMPYSTYPKIVNPDYSPPQDTLVYQEPFEKAYLTDSYLTSPETSPHYTLSDIFDNDPSFDQRLTSAQQMSSGYPSKPPFNPTLPATGISASDEQSAFRPAFYQPPFGQLDQFPAGFGYSLDPAAINSIDPVSFTPITQTSSRTPSLCDDGQQQATSPPISPYQLKRESPPFSPGSLEDDSAPKRPLRKRGRPRLDRSDTEVPSTGSSSAKSQKTGRLPHNQVERKYREGLNSELERLRKAVPTLPQSDDGGAMGHSRPSKAMVLGAAIEYIRKIERERDALQEEVDRLRQNQSQTLNWARGSNSLDEFLMDP